MKKTSCKLFKDNRLSLNISIYIILMKSMHFNNLSTAIIVLLCIIIDASASKYTDDAFFLVNIKTNKTLTMSSNSDTSAKKDSKFSYFFGSDMPKSIDSLNDRQIFQYNPNSKTIKCIIENRCLRISSKNANQSTVFASICNNNSKEQWEFAKASEINTDQFIIKLSSENLCLYQDSEKIKTGPCTSGNNDSAQIWSKILLVNYMIKYASNGYFITSKANPDLLMSIQGNSLNPGTLLIASKKAEEVNLQLYQLWKYDSEKKLLRSFRAPDMSVDLHRGNYQDVILYTTHNGPNQQWEIDISVLKDKTKTTTIRNVLNNSENNYYVKQNGQGQKIICKPQSTISKLSSKYQWNFVPWRANVPPTTNITGKLNASENSSIAPVSISKFRNASQASTTELSKKLGDSDEIFGIECECE